MACCAAAGSSTATIDTKPVLPITEPVAKPPPPAPAAREMLQQADDELGKKRFARAIAGYERARKWILADTSEAARILSEEAKVSLPVALLQIKLRTDLSTPQPGSEHIKALQAAAPGAEHDTAYLKYEFVLEKLVDG